MKKLIGILLLVCTLTLCLASCGVSDDEVVGTWRGEWEYNGNDFVGVIYINEDGTYSKATYKFINYGLDYTLSSSEAGKYEIDGKEIRLYETESKWSTYTYVDGKLENGGHYYERMEND